MDIQPLRYVPYEGHFNAHIIHPDDPEPEPGIAGYRVVDDNDHFVADFASRDVASWFVDAYRAATPETLAPYEENVTYGYLPEDVRPTCPHCRHPVEQPDYVRFPQIEWYGRCGQCGLAEWFQLDEDEDHDED